MWLKWKINSSKSDLSCLIFKKLIRRHKNFRSKIHFRINWNTSKQIRNFQRSPLSTFITTCYIKSLFAHSRAKIWFWNWGTSWTFNNLRKNCSSSWYLIKFWHWWKTFSSYQSKDKKSKTWKQYRPWRSHMHKCKQWLFKSFNKLAWRFW